MNTLELLIQQKPCSQFEKEMTSRLLGQAYACDIYEAEADSNSIMLVKAGNDYQIKYTPPFYNQHEAVVLVLSQPGRWNQKFESVFQEVLQKYAVPEYPGSLATLGIGSLDTPQLCMFRLAVTYLKDPTGGHMVVQKAKPLEGQFCGKDEDEDDERVWTDEERRAKAKEVEYQPLDGMPVGSTITEIILIPNAGEAEGHIIFNAVRQKNLAENTNIDISELTFDRVVFVLSTGIAYVLYNDSEGDSGCAVSIDLMDIEGDLFDLIERPLVVSETASYSPPDKICHSETWTYYRFATPKGFVSMRWFGSSNSYYSEEVSDGLVGPMQIKQALVVENDELTGMIESYEESLKESQTSPSSFNVRANFIDL